MIYNEKRTRDTKEQREVGLIKKAIYNMKFQTRLVLLFLVCALLPFGLSAVLIGNYMIKTDTTRAITNATRTVKRISSDLDVYLHTPEAMISYYIAVLQQDPSSRNLIFLGESVNQVCKTNPGIAGIMVAADGEILIRANIERSSRDSMLQEEWYKTITGANGETVFMGDVNGRKVIRNTEEAEDNLISIGRSFTYVQNGREGHEISRDAVIILDISHSVVKERLDILSISDNGFIFFVDDDNHIIYAPDNPVAYRIDSDTLDRADGSYQLTQIDGEEYLVASSRISLPGCRVVGVIPSSEYESGRRGILQILLMSGTLFVFLAVVLAFGFSHSFIVPLTEMRELMDGVENGDFSVRYESAYNDEIGELGDHFNSMVERMDDLVNRLQAEKQFRLEAELQRVQEQIKPHFLYNTLDTINWLARAGETDEVVKMVEALTNMFRLGLSQGKDYITLRDEITHVSNYLYIQKARYGKKFTYKIDVPEEWVDLMVPKLILQPLVENSIYHGIKLKREPGCILVTGSVEGEYFRLSVWDDGAGMSKEKLARMQEQLDKPAEDIHDLGFGLYYIAKRVQMYYGEGTRMVVESEEGVYTSVSLLIPLEAVQREDTQDV